MSGDILQSILENAGDGVTPVSTTVIKAPTPGIGTADPTGLTQQPGIDTAWSHAGVTFGYNSKLFPSLGGQGDDDQVAQTFMNRMTRAQRAYADHLALTDPQGAAFAYADIDSMKSGFAGLVADGWNAKDAAHAMGVVGKTFGGYSNAGENAAYLKRFAANRGVDMQTAGREMEAYRKEYGAHYLTAYGVTGKVGADSTHTDTINNDFSDILGAMRGVEDQYNWQFDRATYSAVMRRAAQMAGDLATAGASASDIGADQIVRAALSEIGALRDGKASDNVIAQLRRFQAKDRNALSLFKDTQGLDTVANPFQLPSPKGRGAADPTESNDFGLVRGIRQALYNHRVRGIRQGLGPNDFSDISQLRGEIADKLEMFSTGSSGVSRDTFENLASMIAAGVSRGEQVNVLDAARTLARGGVAAGVLDRSQVAALGKWSRSLTMESPTGQRRMQEAAMPFISSFAAASGKTMRDPDVEQFAAVVYRTLRRRFLDKNTVAGLEEAQAEGDLGTGQRVAGDEGNNIKALRQTQIWNEIAEEVKPYIEALGASVESKNQIARDLAASRAMGTEEGKE